MFIKLTTQEQIQMGLSKTLFLFAKKLLVNFFQLTL